MTDPNARGGVRRYLDTVPPEEYLPDTGEVNLLEMSLTGLADLYGSDKGTIKHRYAEVYEPLINFLCAQQGGQPTHGSTCDCGSRCSVWRVTSHVVELSP